MALSDIKGTGPVAGTPRQSRSRLLQQALQRVADLPLERQDAIARQILDALERESDPAPARFQLLIDRKYSSGLTEDETRELEELELAFRTRDEQFYEPILDRLRTGQKPPVRIAPAPGAIRWGDAAWDAEVAALLDALRSGLASTLRGAAIFDVVANAWKAQIPTPANREIAASLGWTPQNVAEALRLVRERLQRWDDPRLEIRLKEYSRELEIRPKSRRVSARRKPA